MMFDIGDWCIDVHEHQDNGSYHFLAVWNDVKNYGLFVIDWSEYSRTFSPILFWKES